MGHQQRLYHFLYIDMLFDIFQVSHEVFIGEIGVIVPDKLQNGFFAFFRQGPLAHGHDVPDRVEELHFPVRLNDQLLLLLAQ